jgi:hypothetical protein
MDTLADLDDLILTVRDRNSRSYISEAVRASRAGAYRSAIMSTWIAVAYDIISKIRELELQGDKAAIAFSANLNKAIQQYEKGNAAAISQLQGIENDLLRQAFSQFEFLSAQECTDLQRLKDDRNLCAHPAFTTQSLLFQPTPESVRAHIVHAIRHLLQHPPVQGQSALVRLKDDLLQPSFPADQAAVSEFLRHRYLNHIKDALLDNFVTVFLKILVRQSEPDLIGKEASVVRCLIAIREHSPARYESKMRQQVVQLAENLTDSELGRILRLFGFERRCWDWIPQSVRIRFQSIIRSYRFDAGPSDYVFEGFAVPDLVSELTSTFASLQPHEKLALISRNPRQEFTEAAIELYRTYAADSWRNAETVGRDAILPLAKHFSAEQIEAITQIVSDVHDVRTANDTPGIVAQLFERIAPIHTATRESWRGLVDRLVEQGKLFQPLQQAMIGAGMLTAIVNPQPKWGASGAGGVTS